MSDLVKIRTMQNVFFFKVSISILYKINKWDCTNVNDFAKPYNSYTIVLQQYMMCCTVYTDMPHFWLQKRKSVFSCILNCPQSALWWLLICNQSEKAAVFLWSVSQYLMLNSKILPFISDSNKESSATTWVFSSILF